MLVEESGVVNILKIQHKVLPSGSLQFRMFKILRMLFLRSQESDSPGGA